MAAEVHDADHHDMAKMTNQPVSAEADWLRHQILIFERRLAQVEPVRAVSTDPLPQPPPPSITTPVGTPPPPSAPAAPPMPPAPSVPPAPRMPAPIPVLERPDGAPDRQVPVAPPPPWVSGGPASTSARPDPVFSLPAIESLLKWSGLILMFLSAVFLVSTAIQRGWIGPELQLAGAGAIGASLIGGGLVIGRRRAGWDVPLVSVGIAVLSATATAGWEWLDLWAPEPWILASFAVLVGSLELTRRLGGPGPAATGLVTASLSVGALADSIAQTAVLVALVVVVGEAASLWRRLSSLHLWTVGVGFVSFAAIAATAALGDLQGSTAVPMSGAVVTGAFWLMPLAMTTRDTLPSPIGINWRPTADRLAISLPVLFTTAWAWTDGLSDRQAGIRMLLVGGVALCSAGLTATAERFPAPVWISQLMGGAAAIAIGTTLVLDGPALVVGMATQAAFLLVFVHLVVDRWAKVQAGFLAALSGLLALTGMIVAIESDAPVIDDLAHLAVVGMVAGWAWWSERSGRRRLDRGRQRLGLWLAGAAFAGLVLWPVSTLVHVPQGQGLISATWAALGLAALVVAFNRSSMRLAQLSLVTLAVVVVKLLSIDLAAVDTFWRVALFFVLGGVFLFASFRAGTVLRARDQDSGLAFQK